MLLLQTGSIVSVRECAVRVFLLASHRSTQPPELSVFFGKHTHTQRLLVFRANDDVGAGGAGGGGEKLLVKFGAHGDQRRFRLIRAPGALEERVANQRPNGPRLLRCWRARRFGRLVDHVAHAALEHKYIVGYYVQLLLVRTFS